MLKIDSNDCCSCPRCPLPFWWVVVTESIGLIAWQRGEGLVQSHKVSFIITKVVEKEVGETASHAHGASEVEPERGVPAALCLLLQDDVIGVVLVVLVLVVVWWWCGQGNAEYRFEAYGLTHNIMHNDTVSTLVHTGWCRRPRGPADRGWRLVIQKVHRQYDCTLGHWNSPVDMQVFVRNNRSGATRAPCCIMLLARWAR